MTIGIISDTHGYLDPLVFEYFKDCDEVWHAGDIGTLSVLHELEAFKPTVAVFGNVDGHEIRAAIGETVVAQRDGLRLMMTHIAGRATQYTPQVRGLITKHRPGVLICGHSHILKVAPDKYYKLLYVNPGAAGKHGFHQMKTLLRMQIQAGKIVHMEAIELGKRGSL